MMPSPVLVNFTDGRRNNLDAVRLLAALLVVISHSFLLTGSGFLEPPFYQNNYGALGVNIFFFISGLLITQSFLRTDSILRYIWARFLRIFPALIVVVLATAFILGPLLTTMPLGSYFTNNDTYSYLSMMTLYSENHYLPGVFQVNFYDSRVNAPLWTLQYEFTFYLAIILLGLLGALKERRSIIGLFVVCLALNWFHIGESTYLYRLNMFYLVRFLMYFSAGMLAYLYRDRIPLRGMYCILILIALPISAFTIALPETFFVFLISYLVLYIGFSPRVNLRWLTRYGDFSYGIYIIAWPVQQTIVYLFDGQMNGWVNLLIAGSIAVLLGAASWHLLEKRMLRLKTIAFRKHPLPRSLPNPR